MGNRVVSDESKNKWITQQLLEFDKLSKSSPGIHAFKFSRSPTKIADGDPNEVVITSEVNDNNNILSVTFKEWHKSPLDIWEPIHTYSNGRVVQAALHSLLTRGYQMKKIQ